MFYSVKKHAAVWYIANYYFMGRKATLWRRESWFLYSCFSLLKIKTIVHKKIYYYCSNSIDYSWLLKGRENFGHLILFALTKSIYRSNEIKYAAAATTMATHAWQKKVFQLAPKLLTCYIVNKNYSHFRWFYTYMVYVLFKCNTHSYMWVLSIYACMPLYAVLWSFIWTPTAQNGIESSSSHT